MNPAPVLLAEDEPHDVFLMERAFRLAGVPNPLVISCNGREAIAYLEGQEPYGDRSRNPLPCLALLDLNMPVLSGFDVLKWLSERPILSHALPVIVFTSSDREEDVARAFELGAHDYLIKPMNFSALVALVGQLNREWLEPLARGQAPVPSASRLKRGPA